MILVNPKENEILLNENFSAKMQRRSIFDDTYMSYVDWPKLD